MKKFLKILGIGLAGVVAFFLAIFVVTAILAPDHDKTFVPFIETAVPRLVTWDVGEYQSLMSEEGFGTATDEQWGMYLQKTSQLGELKSVGVPELKGTSTSTTVAEGAATFATYLVPAEFDTGPAGIQLGLVHRNDEVRINSVKYLSDVFFQESL